MKGVARKFNSLSLLPTICVNKQYFMAPLFKERFIITSSLSRDILKRYNKINYKRFFCVPACVKSILLRRKMGEDIDIWTIGRELDLRVPKKFIRKYPNTKISEKGNFQINLHKKEHSINQFFSKYKLPLMEKYFYRTNKEKIRNLLLSEFKNSDIIVAFDFPTISGINGKWGHVCLVKGFHQRRYLYLIQDCQRLPRFHMNCYLKLLKYTVGKKEQDFG
jgi:hypothetical protein